MHKQVLDDFYGDVLRHTHPELEDVIDQVDVNIDSINQNTIDITNLQTDVNYISGQLDANTQLTTSVYATVAINSGNWDQSSEIEYLSTQITANTANISTISGDLSNLSAQVNINITNISSNTTAISSLNLSGSYWNDTYTTVSANSANWENSITGGVDIIDPNVIPNSIAVFDGSSGKLIKDTVVTIDSSGNIVTPGSINGRRDYGVLSGSPVSPTPSLGDTYFNSQMNMNMFYKDGYWLSEETFYLNFGRRGRISRGSYFRATDGLAFSNENGFYSPFSGMIIGLCFSKDDTHNIDFEVVSNGGHIISYSSSSKRGNIMSLSGIFSPNVVLAVKNSSSSHQAKNVNGVFHIKWLS